MRVEGRVNTYPKETCAKHEEAWKPKGQYGGFSAEVLDYEKTGTSREECHHTGNIYKGFGKQRG